jgi:hypothetical protein
MAILPDPNGDLSRAEAVMHHAAGHVIGALIIIGLTFLFFAFTPSPAPRCPSPVDLPILPALMV